MWVILLRMIYCGILTICLILQLTVKIESYLAGILTQACKSEGLVLQSRTACSVRVRAVLSSDIF